MMEFAYDDTQLQRLFAELEPRRRTQALKGAFRREANRVRRTAIQNLRTSGIRTDKDLEKGIRQVVFKKKAGFRITVGTKGERGYHKNRRGLLKPVLLWAESGTKERFTKSKQGTRKRASRKKAQHTTGRMKRYGFMAKTLDEVRNSVTDDLHREIVENIYKTSKKYGCK